MFDKSNQKRDSPVYTSVHPWLFVTYCATHGSVCFIHVSACPFVFAVSAMSGQTQKEPNTLLCNKHDFTGSQSQCLCVCASVCIFFCSVYTI